MGLYDTVDLYTDVKLPGYPSVAPPADGVNWQTKGIDRPCMGTYRITADGRLVEEEWHCEDVPPEERPYASRDDVDENDIRYLCGCMERVHDGWTEHDDYHGRFQIKNYVEAIDTVVTYQVTFTHGQLGRFERVR